MAMTFHSLDSVLSMLEKKFLPPILNQDKHEDSFLHALSIKQGLQKRKLGNSNCKSTLLQSNSQTSLQSFTFYAAEVFIRESLKIK